MNWLQIQHSKLQLDVTLYFLLLYYVLRHLLVWRRKNDLQKVTIVVFSSSEMFFYNPCTRISACNKSVEMYLQR